MSSGRTKKDRRLIKYRNTWVRALKRDDHTAQDKWNLKFHVIAFGFKKGLESYNQGKKLAAYMIKGEG